MRVKYTITRQSATNADKLIMPTVSPLSRPDFNKSQVESTPRGILMKFSHLIENSTNNRQKKKKKKFRDRDKRNISYRRLKKHK
ncbi:hypothetical protein PUN28_018802 [Cardiocondyla obscurior]|uniref:Mitochondrial mRNA-processing protein COX24 C-terminal domain-containing protein n=1 Tax=Cardiocondyla obscurior TaxID=286306 RepID=A0AAW2ECZ4_9HYME